MFHVKPEDVTARVVGINHMIWLDDLKIKGKDILPMITQEMHSEWLNQSSEKHLTNTVDDTLRSESDDSQYPGTSL